VVEFKIWVFFFTFRLRYVMHNVNVVAKFLFDWKFTHNSINPSVIRILCGREREKERATIAESSEARRFTKKEKTQPWCQEPRDVTRKLYKYFYPFISKAKKFIVYNKREIKPGLCALLYIMTRYILILYIILLISFLYIYIIKNVTCVTW
jgi:hypothetical protein